MMKWLKDETHELLCNKRRRITKNCKEGQGLGGPLKSCGSHHAAAEAVVFYQKDSLQEAQ